MAEFGNCKSKLDGLMSHCKRCDHIKAKEYYERNKKDRLQYFKDSKDRFRERRRNYYLLNREEILKAAKQHHTQNRERINEYTRQWRIDNPDRCKALNFSWWRENYDNNPNFKIRIILRARIGKAIRSQGGVKYDPAWELLGCPPAYLWDHLQALFLTGMTVENYGKVWHIDHVRPCASFDLTDPVQQKECFNWTNLQPLFALDNLKKGAKYDGR